MSFKVLTTPHFEREAKALAKRHRSFKDDLLELVEQLSENPLMGTELSQGIRKIRMAIASKGKGKSGGARVITFVVLESERVYLLDVFDKSDFSSVDVAALKKMVEALL